MSFSVASIVSILIFLVVGYSCYRNGFYSAMAMLFVVVLASATALMCLGPMSRMMFVDQLDWYAPPVVFLGTFILALVILQTLANFLLPPRLSMPKAVDKIGGSGVGLVVALLATGALMTAFNLFPGTGEKDAKVAFLRADEVFVRTMSWMSARAGSTALNADEFLRLAQQEKYTWRVRERESGALDQESSNCDARLRQLGQAIKRYVEANNDAWPGKLKDLDGYLPPHRSEGDFVEMTVCPATRLPYVLFPVKNFKDVEGDRKYMLAYDAVGGEAGHGGGSEGKRLALFADWHVEWKSESDFRGLLKAQREAK